MSEPGDPSAVDGEDVPLDDVDADILDRLDRLVRSADPPPDDLDDRVVFALAWRSIDAEIAALEARTAVAARSDERVRSLAFGADSLEIMMTVTDEPDGRVRIDGWLAPNEAGWEMELRDSGSVRAVPIDEQGRFVVAGAPHGLAQLRATRVQPPGATVVTPAFEL
jgi:hypothetical protein